MSPLLPPSLYQHQQYSDFHPGGQSSSTSNDGLTTPSISALSGGTAISSVGDDDVKPDSTGGGSPMGKKGVKRNKSGAQVSSNSVGEGEIKFDKDGNPKKKRKQLVACDSCRLRRVKCDRADKMGGACSECEKKKITCTDTYVKNKPKTVRSGKLIQQAKALFGDDPLKATVSPPAPSESTPPSNSSQLPVVSQHTTPRPPSRQDLIHLSSSSSQSQLVHSQISRDISSELISTFFSIQHQICPLVDQTQFEIAWNLAGQVTENLTPANECLAAVIQAWASKISDSPLIVGYGVPSLEDVRKGGGDFSLIGNRREEFAQAMKERALRLVDEKGLLRISSAAACSALTLLEFLVTFDDTSRKKTRGRYLMVGACEHLRNLSLGQCDDITESLVPPEQLAGGTLLWMVYTRDALVASIAGRYSCFTEDELTSLCDLFTNPITADVLPYISSNDTRMLSGLAVASMFRHVVACVRKSITLLTSPLARRSPLQEASLSQIWSEIDNSSHLTSLFRRSVESADFGPDAAASTHAWFRDLLGIKGQHTIGVHGMICQRLDEEEARVAKEGPPAPKEDGSETYLDMLRRVKDTSDERLLQVAREWTAMIQSYGSDVLHSAFFTVEYTRDYLHHMVESPSWEQGGSVNYPWASKIDECRTLIETMQIVGWSWAGIDRNIHQARSSLARQGHRIQEREQERQLAQQRERQRHNSYPQQSYPSNDLYPSPAQDSPQRWASNAHSHSHSHSNSHPNSSTPVSLPPHSYATAVAAPAPSLPNYYDSNPSDLAMNFAPTSYPASSIDTSGAPPTSLPPPQSNGLSAYTPPQQPVIGSSSNFQQSTSTNPAYYHYQQQAQPPPQNGVSQAGFEVNGSNGGVGGYVENARGNDEIQRLPSMGYGNGTM
ncbi:hypothetical protein JCM3765_004048 [Sporobolomyces pararoseus]